MIAMGDMMNNKQQIAKWRETDYPASVILPDEYFEMLDMLEQQQAEIKELKQQLAAKSELQGIDWTLVDSDFTHLVQDKETGRMKFRMACYYSDCKDCYHLIATRPKPKYTKEQIEAAKAYDEWLDLNSGLLDADECFEHWLKEVGND